MKSSEGAVSDGGFTIPGESSYEELTLDLARRWKADVIRDSDGTELSPELLKTGMEVYSTICIIRDHNEYALQHPGRDERLVRCARSIFFPGTQGSSSPSIPPQRASGSGRCLTGLLARSFLLPPGPTMRHQESSRLMERCLIMCIPLISSPGVSGRRSACTTMSPTDGRKSI